MTSGTLDTARLGSGTANDTKYLAGDSTWKDLPSGGGVTSVAGKTGVVTLVKDDVGLSNVDNTSDADKPVSTATQTALNGKANFPSANNMVPVRGNEGQQAQLGFSYGAGVNTIAVRDNDGAVTVGTATANGHAVTKLQLETAALTLTNKRIDPRVSTAASASSITPDISAFNQYSVTALAASLTINASTGTPVAGNKLLFYLKDDGTPRTITWNAIYKPIGVTLPTTTVANKKLYVGAVYNGTDWDVIAVQQEA